MRAHEASTEKNAAPVAKRPRPSVTTSADQVLALQRTIGNAAVAGLVGNTAGTIQRVLTVGGNNLTQAAKGRDNGPADQVWQEITAQPAYATRTPGDQAAMSEQFWKWVRDERGTGRDEGSHPVWGRKSQDRIYDDVADLETALHGWVAAKPARREEKAYATQIIASPEVEVRLNSILHRVRARIDEIQDNPEEGGPERLRRIIDQLSEAVHEGPKIGGGTTDERGLGWYEYNLDHRASEASEEEASTIATNITEGVLDVLDNPEKYAFRDKVVAVHDLMEYFGAQRPWNPVSQGSALSPPQQPWMTRSTSNITAEGVRKTTPNRGRAAHQGTRDEKASSTRFARRHGIPVWSGASNTAVQMLVLGQWVNATLDELTALAHSIFAFWRVEYDHTSLAPHTLHEVMDVAQNFGIPYNPLARYENLGHQDTEVEHNVLLADIEGRWDQLVARLEIHEDAPQVQELAQTWEKQLDFARTVLEDFERLPAAERTENLAHALRILARFALSLRVVERDLANATDQAE